MKFGEMPSMETQPQQPQKPKEQEKVSKNIEEVGDEKLEENQWPYNVEAPKTTNEQRQVFVNEELEKAQELIEMQNFSSEKEKVSAIEKLKLKAGDIFDSWAVNTRAGITPDDVEFLERAENPNNFMGMSPEEKTRLYDLQEKIKAVKDQMAMENESGLQSSFNDKEYEKYSASRQEEGRTKGVEVDDVVQENLETGEQKQSPEEMLAQLEQELEEMPKEEQEKIKFGVRNMGFFSEKVKSEAMAKSFEFLASKFDEKGITSRFLKVIAEKYQDDIKNAEEKMKLAEGEKEGGNMLQLQNYAAVTKNVLKFAGLATGRGLMASGATFSKGFEGIKEAHLKSEDVIAKNRMDIDEAEEAAWKLYEKAQKESETGEVSAKDLQENFQKNIPKDVLERLENSENNEAGFASGLMQKFAKRYLEFSAKRMDGKIGKIEGNQKLSKEEKKQNILALLSKYKNQLNFVDQSVSDTGKIDLLAVGARAGELGGKAMMAVSATELLKTVWDKLPDFVEEAEGAEVRIAKGVKSKVVENFNSLSNKTEAPKMGLAQEILSERDASFLENLSKLYPNWKEKSVGSVVSLLNKNPEIEVGEGFNSKAIEAAKKLNILCGGFQKYKNLGEIVKVASENSKKMNMYLSSSEIESVLSVI